MTKLTIYDIRTMYDNFVKLKTSSFLLKTGVVSLIDTTEDSDEKSILINNTLQIFNGIVDCVRKSTLADRLYMEGDITGEKRRELLKNSGISKTISTVFEFSELFDSRLLRYYYDTMIGRPNAYTLSEAIVDSGRISRYFSSTTTGDSDVLAELEYRQRELSSLLQMKEEVLGTNEINTEKLLSTVNSEFTRIDKQIQSVHTQVSEGLNESANGIALRVTELTEIRSTQLAELRAEVQDIAMVLTSKSKLLDLFLESMKTSVDLTPIYQAIEALKSTTASLDQIDKQPSNQITEELMFINLNLKKILGNVETTSDVHLGTVKKIVSSVTDNADKILDISNNNQRVVDSILSELPQIRATLGTSLNSVSKVRKDIVRANTQLQDLNSGN